MSFGSASLGHGNAFAGGFSHSSIYFNPAGISAYNELSVSVDAGQLYNNSGVFHYLLSGIIPSKFGTFGIRLQSYGLESFSYQNYAGVYSRKLFDQLHLAVTFNLYQFRIQDYGNRIMPNFEIGLLSPINEKLSIGAHIANPLPLELSLENNFPTIISFGLQYKINKTLIFLTDIEKNIYNRENIKIGIRYWIHPILELKVGINTYPATFHFGAGINLKSIQIHLGNQYHQILGNTTGISIVYTKQS